MNHDADWQALLVLHHLLPLSEYDRLMAAVVRGGSEGRLSYTDLFESQLTSSPAGGGSWIVRPKPSDDRLAFVLQSLVRSVAWQNDAGFGFLDPTLAGEPTVEVIDGLCQLESWDLRSPTEVIESLLASPVLQPSAIALCKCLHAARSMPPELAPEAWWATHARLLKSTALVVSWLAHKHLADLLADADRWILASEGYSRATPLLDSLGEDEFWAGACAHWRSILTQSKAAAARMLHGPRAALDTLTPIVSQALTSDPLAVVNGASDWLAAALRPEVGTRWPADLRPVELVSPLSIGLLSTEAGFRSMLAEQWQDMPRKYWAVLRRQIALGSVTASRQTKADYSYCLFQGFFGGAYEEGRDNLFWMAVSLLVESEMPELAIKLAWPEPVVDRYVREESIRRLEEHVERFAGCQKGRALVEIQLLVAWTMRLSRSQSHVASAAWRRLARLAHDHAAAIDASVDLGRQALNALRDLGERRPEWRRESVADVMNAVHKRLAAADPWVGHQAALDCAFAYLDVVDEVFLVGLTEAILQMLRRREGRELPPFLTRAALRVLTAPRMMAIHRDRPELRRGILRAIGEYGVERDSGGRLLPLLREFGRAWEADPVLAATVPKELERARRAVAQTNSTASGDAIYSLLSATDLAEPAAVRAAYDGLCVLLESGVMNRASPSLPYAYQILLLIAEEFDPILGAVEAAGLTRHEAVAQLMQRIVALWGRVAVDPMLIGRPLLSGASSPDAVLVHNWAFATLRIAERLGMLANAEAVLERAARNPELVASISLARSLGPVGAASHHRDLRVEIRGADRATFYSALGRWLVQLGAPGVPTRSMGARALLEQCLRFGPREADAVVLNLALDAGGDLAGLEVELADYQGRLRRPRELRLLLGPLVERLLLVTTERSTGTESERIAAWITSEQPGNRERALHFVDVLLSRGWTMTESVEKLLVGCVTELGRTARFRGDCIHYLDVAGRADGLRPLLLRMWTTDEDLDPAISRRISEVFYKGGAEELLRAVCSTPAPLLKDVARARDVLQAIFEQASTHRLSDELARVAVQAATLLRTDSTAWHADRILALFKD